MKSVCAVCPHSCQLGQADVGRCGQRRAQDGRVVALNYGRVSAMALDPVEKKPLFHFHPGRQLLSLGSLGCNLDCSFCQNHHLLEPGTDFYQLDSQQLLRVLLQTAAQHPACVGVAFTYNEPTIGYEWLLDVAPLVQGRQLTSVLVTNGFLNPRPWQQLLAVMDALNIDVKSFSEEFYHKQCGGSLAPVLRNVEWAVEHAHVELTYLVIPGLNDGQAELRRFAQWLAAISPEVPVHLTRYFPSRRLRLTPTPLETLRQLAEVVSEWLNFVYVGNVDQAQNTYCPDCGQLLIDRTTDRATMPGLEAGHCSQCQREIPGIGLAGSPDN